MSLASRSRRHLTAPSRPARTAKRFPAPHNHPPRLHVKCSQTGSVGTRFCRPSGVLSSNGLDASGKVRTARPSCRAPAIASPSAPPACRTCAYSVRGGELHIGDGHPYGGVQSPGTLHSAKGALGQSRRQDPPPRLRVGWRSPSREWPGIDTAGTTQLGVWSAWLVTRSGGIPHLRTGHRAATEHSQCMEAHSLTARGRRCCLPAATLLYSTVRAVAVSRARRLSGRAAPS